MITSLVAAGTGAAGFAGGVVYAVRHFPSWLASMTPRQVDRLLARAEKARFG